MAIGTYTSIITQYINPSPIGETGYRWIVGFEALNYTVPLTISKYSSLFKIKSFLFI